MTPEAVLIESDPLEKKGDFCNGGARRTTATRGTSLPDYCRFRCGMIQDEEKPDTHIEYWLMDLWSGQESWDQMGGGS